MSMKSFMDYWRSRSLRYWLGAGMALALLPLIVAAIAGYVLMHIHVATPLRDVTMNQQEYLLPIQDIERALWSVDESVTDYALDADLRHRAEFEAARSVIEHGFDALGQVPDDDPETEAAIAEAESRWHEAARLGAEILARAPQPGGGILVNGEMMAFEHGMRLSSEALGEVFTDIRQDITAAHRDALAAYERAGSYAVGAALVTLICVLVGITTIDRALVSSTDKLVEGALRVAGGDRSTRIEVQVPPELANVADAFNTMTRRIIAQEEALTRMAATDALTGLENRRSFDTALAEAIAGTGPDADVDAGPGPLSLAVLDIDHFKTINDRFGHQSGDIVLKSVTDTLLRTLRPGERAYRLGGEEFAVLLPGFGRDRAVAFAERARGAIAAQTIPVDARTTTRVTVSIGVAELQGRAEAGVETAAGIEVGIGAEAGADSTSSRARTLLREADQALYIAKNAGRNRVATL